MSLCTSLTDHVGRVLHDDKYRSVSIVTALAVAAGAVLVYRKVTKKRYRLPPGPTPLPLIGNLIEMYRQKDTFAHFENMRTKYGDIYCFYIGSTPVVMLNSSELVREAFIRHGDSISGRPTSVSCELFSDAGKDIFFAQATPLWKAQRKIMHGALRKYLSGDHMENLVCHAVDKVGAALEEKGSEPVDIQKYLSLLTYSVILSMTFGKQIEPDDEFFNAFIDEVDNVNSLIASGLPGDYLPILKYFPSPATRTIKDFMSRFLIYLKNALREHRETYDLDNVTDFTYQLLKMEQEVAEEEDPGILSQMTEAHMIQILSNLFFAGTDTSRLTLTWVVQFMAMYPEMQSKMRTEISEAIGSRRQVRASDRESLPYTYAVIHEALRLRPIAPLLVPHVASSDTNIAGYDIPTGTIVNANVRGIHRDPREWEDPEQFKPERFLDSSGQFLTKAGWLPFSTGKRVCVGESMAKVEILMAVALLCRRFSFEPSPGETLTAAAREGIIDMSPIPFTVVVKTVGN